MDDKLIGCTFALIGVVFIIASIWNIYVQVIVQEVFGNYWASTFMGRAGIPFSTYLTATWTILVLKLIMGFVAMVSGISVFAKQKPKVS